MPFSADLQANESGEFADKYLMTHLALVKKFRSPWSQQKRRHVFMAPGRRQGFTLLELVIVLALGALLAAIAIPAYNSYKRKLENAQAVMDITKFEAEIERYRSNHIQALPAALTDLGIAIPKDPWGQDYHYQVLEGIKDSDLPNTVRRYDNLKPVNADYDLFSVGPDGDFKAKITDKRSLDDVIRINGGSYVGVAGDL